MYTVYQVYGFCTHIIYLVYLRNIYIYIYNTLQINTDNIYIYIYIFLFIHIHISKGCVSQDSAEQKQLSVTQELYLFWSLEGHSEHAEPDESGGAFAGE